MTTADCLTALPTDEKAMRADLITRTARAFVEVARIGELCDQWRDLTDRIDELDTDSRDDLERRADLIEHRDELSDQMARALIEACAWEDK